MADEDIATRAPESDLAAGSVIPGDTVVDQGASMGVRNDTLTKHNPMNSSLTEDNRNTASQTDQHVRHPFPLSNLSNTS